MLSCYEIYDQNTQKSRFLGPLFLGLKSGYLVMPLEGEEPVKFNWGWIQADSKWRVFDVFYDFYRMFMIYVFMFLYLCFYDLFF